MNDEKIKVYIQYNGKDAHYDIPSDAKVQTVIDHLTQEFKVKNELQIFQNTTLLSHADPVSKYKTDKENPLIVADIPSGLPPREEFINRRNPSEDEIQRLVSQVYEIVDASEITGNKQIDEEIKKRQIDTIRKALKEADYNIPATIEILCKS
ncbi:hypothetical protein TVAG_174820 [Trichomonas vaginalis G3]|uniref:Ubiquitin-like domain-containing protein n=1 Tax=Trichomonas vaginalis (strain ATCC PRA-98 / G3) TaxID=412133 RepID=A2EK28_TRIV3|nr:hypothetical protein TVAGG3_0974240 [Trichomonas vaginalis G3]EAY07012.1 hypothetical protein TVAG_174820 [Trichomonas vaginalis G3]KAI5488808.1 hypothetical protein TVAGG3_0974240 [Trichomonas vaginalis G3]|eukprot:XP_001319235.1 hypothetical protein [Trichomonas vaginalis G3]